jgi:hypothetical protein
VLGPSTGGRLSVNSWFVNAVAYFAIDFNWSLDSEEAQIPLPRLDLEPKRLMLDLFRDLSFGIWLWVKGSLFSHQQDHRAIPGSGDPGVT